MFGMSPGTSPFWSVVALVVFGPDRAAGDDQRARKDAASGARHRTHHAGRSQSPSSVPRSVTWICAACIPRTFVEKHLFGDDDIEALQEGRRAARPRSTSRRPRRSQPEPVPEQRVVHDPRAESELVPLEKKPTARVRRSTPPERQPRYVRYLREGLSPSERPARPRERELSRSAIPCSALPASESGSDKHQRTAGIATFAQPGVERNLTQERHLVTERLGQSLGDQGAATGAEDVDVLTAVRARQISHVFHDADDVLPGLAGDGAGALGHFGSSELRGGDQQQLGGRAAAAPGRWRRRRCPAAGRAVGRRGRPSRRRRETAAGRGAASARAR